MESEVIHGRAPDAEEALSRLASGNSALQNLLRRLENGLDDLLPNSSGKTFLKIHER
jgi:hypothetical protein